MAGLAVAWAAAHLACGGARSGVDTSPREATVERHAVEDVYLLTGDLRAVRSVSLVTPRGEGEAQIRWMADDGAEVAEGDRVVELDASRLIQNIEDRRLKLRQAGIDAESRERTLAADAERKRVAVEKAEVEAEKARLDADVPRELRPAAEWAKMQTTLREKEAALQKARFDQQAHRISSRADLRVLRVTEEKARREVDAAERSLGGMSLRAPRNGIFQVGNHWQWGPEGARKLQPGDTVWSGYPIASIPDPSQMEVSALLSEVDHGRIAAGMKARCILDTYPDRVFEGRVEEVGSVAAEARPGFFGSSRAGFSVRVSLARTDPLMRPGLSVRVEVVRGAWPGALAVPRGAVRFENDAALVKRGRRTQPVRLAACTPTECVVEQGLAEGDRVLIF